MRFRAAWALLATAVWAPAAEIIPTELFPPDTRILLSFSVRSLLASPLLKDSGGDGPTLNTSFGAAMPLAGIDPLKDLDTVIVATSGQGDDAPGLAVLRGRFAGAKTKGATYYHGVPMIPDPKDAQATMAVLDNETAMVGPKAELEAAIDRRNTEPVLDPALASRVPELNGSYDFWSVGRMPLGLATANPAMKSLQSIDMFEFAATLQDGLRLRGEIHMRTPEDAAQLESTFQSIGAMVNAHPSPGGTKFDLHPEHGRLQLDLFIPEAELRKAMTAQKASLASLLPGGIGAGMGILATATPRPASAAATPASGPPVSHPPRSPGRIINNERGETVNVTLPGQN